jgi:hypothetical protein
MNTATLRQRIAATLSAVLVISGILVAGPQPAHALIVSDPGHTAVSQFNLVESTISAVNEAAGYTKDYALDTLAWQVANMAIESITKSTVNWINSGFQGSPAFVTDLNENLRGVGDAVAARFFEELASSEIAATPFQDKVLDSIRLAYYLRTSPESFYTRNPYTLNQVSADDQAFLKGDFKQGGFNAWFSTVMNPQNNPYGAQMLANEALENAVAGATGNRLEELSWNRGFLSWRGECQSSAGGHEEGHAVSLGGEDPCDSYEIETPGSVIMEQLNQQLGSGVERLVSADEFNEIIGALLNQLAMQVLGGDSGGLRGVSRPSTGGGGSFLDTTTNSSQGSGAAINRTFSSTIANQLTRIDAYRAAWEKIRVAAEEAKQRCENRSDVQDVLNRAATALTKAANARAALEAIQAKLAEGEAAGGDRTLGLLDISNEYNDLTTSGTLPSAQEMAEAVTQSQDTDDQVPGSLYSQMKRLSSSVSCRASSE